MSSIDLKQYRGGYRHPFLYGTHYNYGVGDPPRTLTELAMAEFSAELRQKPDWHKHYNNEKMRDAWMKAARERGERQKFSRYASVELSQKQIEYVIDELAGYAALRDPIHNCQVSCFDRIWESDSVIDRQTRGAINEELEKFDSDPNPHRHEKPRSWTKTNHIDLRRDLQQKLVDPARYCVIYDKTLISEPNKPPRPLPPLVSRDIYPFIAHSSLLPTTILVSDCGSTVKFQSYINNINPHRHPEHYEHLETCLRGFIPLFEHCLTDLHLNNPLRQRISGPYHYTRWDEPESPEHSDDEEAWSAYELEKQRWSLTRPIQLPDVPDTGYPGGLEDRKICINLRGRKLQVIIEITQIRLNHSHTYFPRSDWHSEGTRNESIVASGVYFLSVKNISPADVGFRMAVSHPHGICMGDGGAIARTWGFHDGDPCNQYIGCVPIREGLGLVFPNIYQHSRGAFFQEDPSTPTELTILSFYLVDPDIEPIVSTSEIPPQQKEWYQEALYDTLRSRLPTELIDHILCYMDYLMTKDEATIHERRYSKGRASFQGQTNSNYFCIPFDLWNEPL